MPTKKNTSKEPSPSDVRYFHISEGGAIDEALVVGGVEQRRSFLARNCSMDAPHGSG